MGLPNVRTGFDVDPRLLHDAVLDPKQPVVEPPVDGADPLGRRKSKASSWPARVSHSLRGRSRSCKAYHSSPNWLVLTLSSCRPWTMNTGTSMLSMRGM